MVGTMAAFDSEGPSQPECLTLLFCSLLIDNLRRRAKLRATLSHFF